MAKGKTPLVGVTTYRQDARPGGRGNDRRRCSRCPTWTAWPPWAGVHCSCPRATARAATTRRPSAVIGVLDALVLVGGGDVDPSSYGASPDPATSGVNPRRDDSERALLTAALDADLPVLAICRGMQVLNVHLGGTLHQHLPDVVGHTGHQPAVGCFGTTEVGSHPSPGCRRSWARRPPSRARITRRSTTWRGTGRHGARRRRRHRGGRALVGALRRRRAMAPGTDGDLRLFDALVRAGG